MLQLTNVILRSPQDSFRVDTAVVDLDGDGYGDRAGISSIYISPGIIKWRLGERQRKDRTSLEGGLHRNAPASGRKYNGEWIEVMGPSPWYYLADCPL